MDSLHRPFVSGCRGVMHEGLHKTFSDWFYPRMICKWFNLVGGAFAELDDRIFVRRESANKFLRPIEAQGAVIAAADHDPGIFDHAACFVEFDPHRRVDLLNILLMAPGLQDGLEVAAFSD